MKREIKILTVILSVFCPFSFIGIWGLLLFKALPVKDSVFVEGYGYVASALSTDNPDSWFFLATIISIVIGLICCLMFLFSGLGRLAMLLVALHSVAAFFIYSFNSFAMVALPLLMLPYYLARSHENA